MKQHRLAIFAALTLLGLVLVGCGAFAASSRGWARPVASDNLYLVSPRGGHLAAINRETLRLEWSFPDYWQFADRDADDLDGIYGAPIVASDGDTVYLGDYNGFVYTFKLSEAISPQERQLDRTRPFAASFELAGPIIGGLVLDEDSDTLYVAAGDRLHALNTEDLAARALNRDASVREQWTPFQAGDDIWSTPLRVAGGLVIVASLDGKLYAVDETTGVEAWNFDAGSGLVSQPVVIGDSVLVGSFNSRLYAVLLASGEEKWSFKASNWVWSEPRQSNGTVFVGDFDGRVYAVNAETGQLIWQTNPNRGPVIAAPLPVDDTLIIATEDGWLIGLDIATQETLWRSEVGAAINADPVLIDGRIVIAPKGCVTPEGRTSKVYYISVDPETGLLEEALDIC